MATTLATLRERLRVRLQEIYALATPGAPLVSPQGTTGAKTITYKLTAVNAVGESAVSQSKSISTAATTLNSTNYNQLTWVAVPGAVSYNVYRTATNGTPSTTGLIGNTSSTTFNDTGLAGDSATAPTINTSGLVSAFWTETELLDYLQDGCRDLWRAIIDLHQGHFTTINASGAITTVSGSNAVTGVPSDCFRILAIEPLNSTQTGTARDLVFKPLSYHSRGFETLRGLSASDPGQGGFVYYDILNAGSPVEAPSIIIGPLLSSAVPLRLTYVHTLGALVSTDNNPIPGESDNCLIAWAVAYARAKEREDHMPDPAWLSIYATDKQSLLTALTPRQEQEEQYVEGLFDAYWP